MIFDDPIPPVPHPGDSLARVVLVAAATAAATAIATTAATKLCERLIDRWWPALAPLEDDAKRNK